MKYIFVGNRAEVLKKMRQKSCEIVKIFAIKNSYLEKFLKENMEEFIAIESKEHLIKEIEKVEFDCLVSNGCPYILPIDNLKKGNQKFINIHPSLLPDLKGKHPINGAILYGRKHGVSCHLMDNGIDTGDVITSIEIPITEDMSLGLIYQISFLMEGEVFEKALKLNFEKIDETIYYTRKSTDSIINKGDTLNIIKNKIRAFGINGMYAKYVFNEKEYCCKKIKIIDNSVLDRLFFSYDDNTIILKYENCILVKKEGKYVEIELESNEGIEIGEKFL